MYYTGVENGLYFIVNTKTGKIKLLIDICASVCVLKRNEIKQTGKINFNYKTTMWGVAGSIKSLVIKNEF